MVDWENIGAKIFRNSDFFLKFLDPDEIPYRTFFYLAESFKKIKISQFDF